MPVQAKTFIEKYGALLLGLVVQMVFVVAFVVNVNATNLSQGSSITLLQAKVEKLEDIRERLARLEANDQIQMKLLHDILSDKGK